VRHVVEQRVDDRHDLVLGPHADVHVHPEDLQLLRHPLVALDQHPVALAGRDPLRRPVRRRVRARAQHAEVAAGRGGLHLGHRGGQVGPRLRHRRADSGDHLDAGLQQLVLGLGVVDALGRRQLGQDLVGSGGQLAGVEVDQLQLPLDPQAGPLGGAEVDPHPTSVRVRPGPAWGARVRCAA
jgi:hypothetical protein